MAADGAGAGAVARRYEAVSVFLLVLAAVLVILAFWDPSWLVSEGGGAQDQELLAGALVSVGAAIVTALLRLPWRG